MNTKSSLIIEASKKSSCANSFGNHGMENFGECVESLEAQGIDITAFDADTLAKVVDCIDHNRQVAFVEGVKSCQYHGEKVLCGYDSTTDHCDADDFHEEENNDDEFNDDEDEDDEQALADEETNAEAEAQEEHDDDENEKEFNVRCGEDERLLVIRDANQKLLMYNTVSKDKRHVSQLDIDLAKALRNDTGKAFVSVVDNDGFIWDRVEVLLRRGPADENADLM